MAKVTVAQAAARARARRRTARVPAVLTLGLWRGRRMWRLLAVMELGMLAAVVLACAVPLFAQVATVAGSQGMLASRPGVTDVEANIQTNDLSPAMFARSEQRVESAIRDHLAAYHVGSPTGFLLSSQRIQMAETPAAQQSQIGATGMGVGGARTAGSAVPLRAQHGGVTLYGKPLQTVQREMVISAGGLPEPRADGLEVLITQQTAERLHVAVGSTLALAARPDANAHPLQLYIVGTMMSGGASSWPTYDPSAGAGSDGQQTDYFALTSTEAALAARYDWSALQQSAGYAGPDGSQPALWNLNWTYRMDLSHLSASDVTALLVGNPQRFNTILYQAVQGIPGAQSASMFSEVFIALYKYQRRAGAAQTVVGVLLLDVLGLVLLGLGLLMNLLVERQEALVATLRSRGASQGQVFGAFAWQGIGLGLLAFLAGPLLAIPVTRGVAGLLLPADKRDALSVLDGNPLVVAASVRLVAGIVAAVVVLALLWRLRKAAALNVLGLRREATRSTRKPAWQRMYLDVVVALLAAAGYGMYALASRLVGQGEAATNTALAPASRLVGQGEAATNTALALSPLALVAPIFLTVAAALLFARLFPLLLRLGERAAARGDGTAALLALAQLARSPQRAMRMTLLLGLTTCFAVFAVCAQATLARHAEQGAAFQAGADFSGALVTRPAADERSVADATAAYERVPGVLATALGYRTIAPTQRCSGQYCSGDPSYQAQIAAVDAEAFARTAIWLAQDAGQPLAAAMATLAAHRTDATGRDVVYAVLDANCANLLRVGKGDAFTLPLTEYATGDMHFVVAAVVPYLPGMYASDGGGILADYESFATVYTHDTSDATRAKVAPNFAWLRTRDDAASLASVRTAIANGPLQLTSLTISPNIGFVQIWTTDRRALIADLQGDPLRLDAAGGLAVGAAAALMLALFGVLIAAWTETREQRTAWALLQALGMAPRRVTAVLAWEQGIVYAAALALGLVLGAALAAVMLPELPVLIFSSAFGGPFGTGGPPVRLVWPVAGLALLLGGLAVICMAAVAVTSRVAARPTPGAALRLNED